MHLPQLPAMRCDRGCGECCGPVMCTAEEYQAITAAIERRGIVPIRQGTTCPLWIGGECAVYEARPLICRLFGHAQGMTCSRGYNVNISASADRRIMQAYSRSMGGRPRMLHEFVFTPHEIESLLEAALTIGVR